VLYLTLQLAVTSACRAILKVANDSQTFYGPSGVHFRMQYNVVIYVQWTTAILGDITSYSYLSALSKNYDFSTRTLFPERWNFWPSVERLSSARAIFLQFPFDFAHNSIGHRTFGKTFKLRDNVKFWSCCPVWKRPFLERTPYWTSGYRCAEITYM